MTKLENSGQARLDCLALTISPPEIKLTLKETFILHLKRLSKIDSKFVLYPETDIKGRLHYHGIIWKDRFYKDSLEQLSKMGFIKVKKLTDPKGWMTYCKKELKITKSMLDLYKKFKFLDNEYVSKYKPHNTSRDILSYFEA